MGEPSSLGETPTFLEDELEVEVLLLPRVGLLDLSRSLSTDLSLAEVEVGVADRSCFSLDDEEVEVMGFEVGLEVEVEMDVEEEEVVVLVLEIGTSIPISRGVEPSESPVYFRKTLTKEVKNRVCSLPCSVCHR